MDSVQLINDDWLGHADHLRHACRGIIYRDGQILLGYESLEDKYIIPGGGVESDEALEQCCERELLEETGVICRALRQYLTIEELFSNWQHINHYFVCEPVEDTGITHLTEREAAAGVTCRWVSLEKALEIFGDYERFRGVNIPDYGLYRREYTALLAFAKEMNS